MVNAAPRDRLQGWEMAMLIQGPTETSSKRGSYSLIYVLLRAKEHMIKTTNTSMLYVDASVKCLNIIFVCGFCLLMLQQPLTAASFVLHVP